MEAKTQNSIVTLRDLPQTTCNFNSTVTETNLKAHFPHVWCLGWGRNTGPSCPLEIITPTTCSFVSKNTSSTSLSRESAATIFASSMASLMWISWATREQTENVMKQREAFPIPPEISHPSSPAHCCSAWTQQCTSQPCLILLRIHTWSTVNHTSSTPFNSLPHLRSKYMKIKHGNLWRKITVSFIFMKQVMSAWGASESPPSGAKHTAGHWAGSAKPSSHMESDGGKHYFFQCFIFRKRFDKFNNMTRGPSLSNSNTNGWGFQRKSEMSKFQIKVNTVIEIFLLICHEISWLYIFQSFFQLYLPIIQKFLSVFKCSNLLKMLF